MNTFVETQRFSKSYFYALLLGPSVGIGALLGVGIYLQLFRGVPFGSRPMSDQQLLLFSGITMLLLLGVSVLFLLVRFTTRISGEGVAFQYYPFHLREKFFPWSRIRKIKLVRYQAFRDFGGHGIRETKGRKAFTVSGNHALSITLEDGETILLGTKRTRPLRDFLLHSLKLPIFEA